MSASSLLYADAPVNVGAIRDFNRKELVDILDSVHGRKVLVIDPGLSGPLSLVCEFSLLKEHGVEKIYHLLAGRLDTDCRQIVYLTRPSLVHMKYIADQVKRRANDPVQSRDAVGASTTASPTTEFHLYLTPKRTAACERVLEEEGAYGDVRIGEYHLDLVPLEGDLLSLEMDDSFRCLYHDGDYATVAYMTRALVKLQSIFGVIPKIYGKGHYSRMLVEMMLQMRQDMATDESLIIPEIGAMVVVDRTVDLVTPLLTQLTYEGLIDEEFELKNTFVELDPEISGHKERRKVQLNSADQLYASLRDLHFSVVVGDKLGRVARELNEGYEERHNAKTVSQLKEFVGRLGTFKMQKQWLSLHINIASYITKNVVDDTFHQIRRTQQNLLAGLEVQQATALVEDLIGSQHSLQVVLRLLCLLCIVQNGIKPRQFDFFRQEILQTYGYHHLLTLDAMARCGLFYSSASNVPTSGTAPAAAQQQPYGPAAAPSSAVQHRMQFTPTLQKQFNLLVDDDDQQQPPRDMAYVYSGYAPLTCRLVQHTVSHMFFGGEYGIHGTSATAAGGGGVGAVGKAPTSSLWGGMLGGTGSGALQNTGGSSSGRSRAAIVDLLNTLPGPTVEEVQRPPMGGSGSGGGAGGGGSDGGRRIVLVVFMGGCTSSEVSALRHLSSTTDATYIVATTHMINGRKLVASMMSTADYPGGQ